jgi:glycosyltransferase involved in cell wall biosynthesis
MNFNPLVSIVIPVYNGGNYMREAIDSALAQIYTNCEVIVVNDGSTDEGETERIALSYGDSIRYFFKPNGGVASALNKGISEMRGEYFSWLSHDDIYLPQKVEAQISALTNEDHTSIVYCSYELIDKYSRYNGEVVPSSAYAKSKLQVPLFPLLRGLINGCTLLIHKKHFDRAGFFDTALITTQDYELWFTIFRDAQIIYLEEKLVRTRVHATQGSKTIKCHMDECENLWISMMTRLTEDEMCAIEGNPYAFYKRTEEFLRKYTSYEKAISKAMELASSHEQDMLRRVTECTVSVIIPFHNRLNLLIESVKSVVYQTHPHVEIILVDDGSTEDLSPLHEIIQGDSRIHLLHQEKKGASAARNRGLQEASGEYIAFLDSDDLFNQDKLRIQLEFMYRNGLAFSHTSYRRILMDGTPSEVIHSGTYSGIVFPKITGCFAIATPTVIIRKDIIMKTNLFPENIHIGEDLCAWIDLLYKHECGGLDQPLTDVRISPNTTALCNNKQRIGLTNILQYLLSQPEYAKYETELYELCKLIILTFPLSQKKKLPMMDYLFDRYIRKNSTLYYLRNHFAENFFNESRAIIIFQKIWQKMAHLGKKERKQ